LFQGAKVLGINSVQIPPVPSLNLEFPDIKTHSGGYPEIQFIDIAFDNAFINVIKMVEQIPFIAHYIGSVYGSQYIGPENLA
jgi:hypothetical protein